MSYKKVIISLDIMSRKVFDKFNTFANLQFQPAEEIWKYFQKTGNGVYNPKTMFNEAPIAETFLALDYIKQNHPKTKPEFWYHSSLFIYNDDLYSIRNNECTRIDLNEVLFISFREAWSHPFFGILKILLEKNNGKLAKPNMATMKNNGCLNKFFALKELYSHREKFIGDVIIPYSVKPNEIDTLISFVQQKMGNKIVIKKDCIQEGKGVMFRDISRTGTIEKIKNDIKRHKSKGHEVIITPALNIKREYRCYFTNDEHSVEVYSIKQRVNTEDIDVYSKDNIQIYKNISAKWHEVRTDSKEFKVGSDLTKVMLQYMSYDTGCLEFAEVEDGTLVFFEVNQMAGPLPFEGEDTENMNRYYNRILERIFT